MTKYWYLIRIRNVRRPKDVYDIRLQATDMNALVVKAYRWLMLSSEKLNDDEIIMIKRLED